MADQPRSLEDIESYLAAGKPMTPDEPRRVLHELAQHMIRQQKEIDALKRGSAAGGGGTPIVRSPSGNIHL